MSLLLDALKKAADDKQKAADRSDAKSRISEQHDSEQDLSEQDLSQQDTSEQDISKKDKAQPGSSTENPDDLATESAAEVPQASADPRSSDDELALEELSLDVDVQGPLDNPPDETVRDPADDENQLKESQVNENDLALEDIAVEKHNTDDAVSNSGETDHGESEEAPSVRGIVDHRHAGADDEPPHTGILTGDKDAGVNSNDGYEVSDEALNMLINKTKREVKFGRRLIISSVVVVTLLIMISGGIVSYLDTQTEIVALERKHRIAMQAMQAKISGEKDPDNIDVIRNLVSDARLEEKVEYVKKQMADKNRASKKNNKAAIVSKPTQTEINNDKTHLSIQKTNRTDPIEEKLDDAWLAYDAGNYSEAKENYQAVLDEEKNNRDALLGMGAIAIVEKNSVKAGEYYLALLEQDPRDPIATAALSSLHFDDTSRQQHEDHLLGLLEKNPQSAPLNFALGNVYAQQQKWKAAQQSYFSAWQNDADNANYLYNLAVSMDQLGKHRQAIAFYENSLQKANNKQISFSRESVKKRINELSEL